MNSKQNKWDVLWELFDKLTNSPRKTHREILSKEQVSDEIKKELEQLLDAHYSQSTVLDKQPEWQSDFNQAFEPPIKINGYKIEEKLGSGGMGDVYLASKAEEGFTRKVAIKFATIGRYSKHVLNSFNTELEVLLSLNHSNIERLYDGGITQDNVPFLIVEHIDGLHIDEHCEKNKLNLKQRLLIFQKVCGAVDAVHRSLIIHRDIKSGNIMVGKDGEPKLLDFGLAKLNAEDKEQKQSTKSGQMMTLAYASPEQINGERVNTTSDIYSLGILLYYLIAGKLPYKIKPNNFSASIKSITEQQTKLASKNTEKNSEIYKTEPKLSKKLTGDLEQIVAKAISKKPEQRYLSATQFSGDIENFLNNRPVVAKKDSVLYRFGKFVQRHKTGVSLSTAAVLSLILLSINLYIQSSHLKQSLIEINQEQKRVLQVTDFLKSIFKISDPLLTDRKIVEVKQLLDYSSKQLEAQFNDEKQTKATLYLTLGNVYLNMSDLTQAEAMFSKALLIFTGIKDTKGKRHVELAQVRLLQQQGKIQQAQILVTGLYKNVTQTEDLLVEAEIEVLYGQNLYKLGQLKQAEQILKSALNKRLLVFGKEHELVVNIYLLLGNVYWRLGEFEKVKRHYQKAHSINQKLYGNKNHKTLKSRSSLGVLAYAQGDHETALEYLSFVANARLEKLGKQHILTAEAFNRLGAIYYETGNYVLAQKKLILAKETYINLGLNQSLKYAKTLNNLGLVERQNRQYKQAQQTFIEAKKIEISVLGEQHEDVASMHNNLGMVAADLGEINKALILFKKAYTVIHNKSGDDNVNLAFSMTNIGRMYLQKENLQKAQTWVDKALKLRLKKLGKENLYYIETLSASAEIDLQKKQLDIANQKLNQVLLVRETKLPKNDWRIAEAKALYSLTELETNENAIKSFICNYKLVTEKLGKSHYRVQMLEQKQQKFNISQKSLIQQNTETCQIINKQKQQIL